MNKPHVYMFDLEGTIIQSWNNRIPINKNISKIKNIISQNQKLNVKYGIFSFAVEHDYEVQTGIDIIKKYVGLNVDKDFVITVDNMKDMLSIHKDDYNTQLLIFRCFGKQYLFQLFASQYPELDFTLFDDTVENIIRQNKDNNQTISTITMENN